MLYEIFRDFTMAMARVHEISVILTVLNDSGFFLVVFFSNKNKIISNVKKVVTRK